MGIVSTLRHQLSEDFARKFLGRSLLAFFIKLISAGLSFVMFVLLARAMGRLEYGVFASVFSLATLLAVVGSFGQRPVVLRFGAAYHEHGKHDLRRGVTRRGYLIVFLGCSLAAVLGGLIYQLSGNGISAIWIGTFLGLTLSLAVAEYQSFALRITSGLVLALIPRDIFWRLIICGLAACVISSVFPAPAGALEWVWILVVSLTILLVIQFFLNERQVPESKIFGSAQKDSAMWNGPARNLWLSSIVMIMAQSLSVILVERQVGLEAAGPYFSALRTAQLLNLFLFATSVICSPMLSRSLSRGDWDETQRVCSLTVFVGGGFGTLGFGFIVLAGGQLLGLFGEGFETARLALIVLAGGFLVNTLAGPTGPLLEMSGHEKAYFRTLLWPNLVGLTLLPLAIYWQGILGAAFCTALISAGWNIVAVIYCRRRVGVDPSVLLFLLGKPKTRPASQKATKTGGPI